MANPESCNSCNHNVCECEKIKKKKRSRSKNFVAEGCLQTYQTCDGVKVFNVMTNIEAEQLVNNPMVMINVGGTWHFPGESIPQFSFWAVIGDDCVFAIISPCNSCINTGQQYKIVLQYGC